MSTRERLLTRETRMDGAVQAEAEELPRPPAPGRIREAQAAVQAAEDAAWEVQVALDATLGRLAELRTLQQRGAVDVAEVATLTAREAEIAQLATQAAHLRQLAERCQAELQARRDALWQLQERLRDLHPQGRSLRRQLAEAEHERAIRERDLAHQVNLSKRHIDALQRAIDANEQEIRDLAGEAAS